MIHCLTNTGLVSAHSNKSPLEWLFNHTVELLIIYASLVWHIPNSQIYIAVQSFLRVTINNFI
jgi:hypothetical protein